jgi:uncharacterized membrane protein (DUF4010 family)
MTSLPLFENFALALALAFFFGLSFEFYYGQTAQARPGGVRTFPLLALAGAVLYVLEPKHLIPLSVGLGALGLWLAIYYYRRSADQNEDGQATVGLMVPVCNFLAFLLGPAAVAQPRWVPIGITAAAVLFLTSRDRLHRFARELELSELVTAGKFLVLTGLVLPLLPNHEITTLTAITPRQAWLALIAVSGLSYVSYLLQRFVMPKGATLVVAVLGGLYSSTATAVALARQARQAPRMIVEAQTGILLATSVMYLRTLVIVAVFDVALAARLAVPALGLFVLGSTLAGLWYGARRADVSGEQAVSAPQNPLALSTAALFAVLFVAISIATNWARARFGESGVYALAGVVGLADVDPFVINLAEGGARALSTSTSAAAILVATSSNNLLKAVYTGVVGGRRIGFVPAGGLALLAVTGLAAAIWIARA